MCLHMQCTCVAYVTLHAYVLYMDVTIWDSWYENKKDLPFLSLLSIAVASITPGAVYTVRRFKLDM